MAEETTQKSRVNIADIMGSIGGSSNGGDAEILSIASNYSLRLNPDQINSIMWLKRVEIKCKTINKNLSLDIGIFIKEYLQLKHFHESEGFIGDVIKSLSLSRIFTNDAGKVNVMK